MFSPSDKTKDLVRERSSEREMTSKQNHLNLQIPSSTPARNTIRTSPNTQPMQQQNGQEKYGNCQETVFNFTDDCNYQGRKKLSSVELQIIIFKRNRYIHSIAMYNPIQYISRWRGRHIRQWNFNLYQSEISWKSRGTKSKHIFHGKSIFTQLCK